MKDVQDFVSGFIIEVLDEKDQIIDFTFRLFIGPVVFKEKYVLMQTRTNDDGQELGLHIRSTDDLKSHEIIELATWLKSHTIKTIVTCDENKKHELLRSNLFNIQSTDTLFY